MPRLLVTGASGTLGAEVARQALEAGWDVVGTYHRAPLDLPIAWRTLALDSREATRACVEAVRPDAIVHAAYAWRADRPDSWRVTAVAPAWVAQTAEAVGARLVHLSSDAVFDGTRGPYAEPADPSPVTPYGAAKAAAEVAVAQIAPTAAIVRTSLIVRVDPADPQTQMVLDIAEGRRTERLFSDEYRSPVAVDDLAAAVLELVSGDHAGVLHVAGPESVSRLELGRLIVARSGGDPDALPAWTIAESGLRRPADVRLDIDHARSLLRTRLRGVSEFLQPGRASG